MAIAAVVRIPLRRRHGRDLERAALITPGDGAAQDIARDIQSETLTSIAKAVTWFGQWPVAAVVLAAGSIGLLIDGVTR